MGLHCFAHLFSVLTQSLIGIPTNNDMNCFKFNTTILSECWLSTRAELKRKNENVIDKSRI